MKPELGTWIGAKKVAGKWTWTDGSKWDYKSWDKGQPDNRSGQTHCVNQLAGKLGGEHTKWEVQDCKTKRYAICAFPWGSPTERVTEKAATYWCTQGKDLRDWPGPPCLSRAKAAARAKGKGKVQCPPVQLRTGLCAVTAKPKKKPEPKPKPKEPEKEQDPFFDYATKDPCAGQNKPICDKVTMIKPCVADPDAPKHWKMSCDHNILRSADGTLKLKLDKFYYMHNCEADSLKSCPHVQTTKLVELEQEELDHLKTALL